MNVFRLPKGHLRGRIEENLVAFVRQLPAGREWVVTIKQATRKRSDEQNRYHFGVIVKTLCDATGYEKHDVHELLCGEFFGWVEKRVPRSPNFPSGVCSKPRRTTTTNEEGREAFLDKVEFMEFVAFCQRFAATKGIFIPDPE